MKVFILCAFMAWVAVAIETDKQFGHPADPFNHAVHDFHDAVHGVYHHDAPVWQSGTGGWNKDIVIDLDEDEDHHSHHSHRPHTHHHHHHHDDDHHHLRGC